MNPHDKIRLKIVAIVQARMGSTRLPGKVLLDIKGKPMLARVVDRCRRAAHVDQVIVATTTDKSDDPIAAMCIERGYPFFRGSSQDVLDRYYQAAKTFQAEVIARITADCPLIDPGLIDEVIADLFGGQTMPTWDFAANRLPPPWKRTYPIGLDVEVCTFQALERAWREAELPYQREHVMPYLYEIDGRFRVRILQHEPDLGALRWTVDTSQDLELVREIYARFDGRDDFSWQEVLELFGREPELAAINASVVHKSVGDVDQRH